MSASALYLLRAMAVGFAAGVLCPEQPRSGIATVLLIVALELGDAARTKRSHERRLSERAER